jgi:hypothetical protein
VAFDIRGTCIGVRDYAGSGAGIVTEKPVVVGPKLDGVPLTIDKGIEVVDGDN